MMLSSSPVETPQRSAPWRIALLFLILGSVFWIGGITVRAILGGDMLKFGTLEFEDYLSPDVERELFRLISIVSIVILTSYVVVLVSSVILLMTSPLRLREHGWLMMSAILFYVFVPVEAFTGYLDAKMIYYEFFTTVDNTAFRELFIARIGALKGAPIVAMLCYYTIIVLAVFQPFRRPPDTAR